MLESPFLVINKDLLPELARQLKALMVASEVEADPYLTAKQLAERVPVLTAYGISKQISEGKYGKKFGAKGRLVAKESEVKKYNRI